jgi:hypothetical protein
MKEGWPMFATILKGLTGGEGRGRARRDRGFRPSAFGLEGLEGRRVPSGFGINGSGTITNGDGPPPPTPILIEYPTPVDGGNGGAYGMG